MPLTIKMLETQSMRQRKDDAAPKFVYLGAGAKNRTMETWVRLVGRISRYVDITAGSCNQPYVIGSLQRVPVMVNDVSYYSYCIGVGLFRRRKETNLKAVAETVVQAEDCCREGMFTEFHDDISYPVATYVDGLIALINTTYEEADAAFLKACVGRTLLGRYTYRAMKWYKPKGCNILLPDGTEPTVEQFAKDFYRAAFNKNRFLTPGEAYWSSAKEFIKWADLEDATVNIDPAWPFAKRQMRRVNPYDTYVEIGSILAQRDLGKFDFWEDKEPEAILEEFLSWVQACLDKGAREVYGWNQTTNVPTKDQLFSALQARFNCEEVLTVSQPSTGHKYNFADYVHRLKRK